MVALKTLKIHVWTGLSLAFLLTACGGGSEKKVYFGNLEDGANVESPFKVQMKAENLIVEPATMGVTEGHGHFHILVDVPLASPSEPMIADATHIHYGKGQTETDLNLPVGQHTLILQFAKGNHVPYDPPVYQQVQVNVTKQNPPVDSAQAVPATAPMADSGKAGNADSAKAGKSGSTKTKSKKTRAK